MYQRCIFCSAHLGANEVVEAFPVGRRLAFDEWKGWLWAICPRCRRWNLAPLEERWEAVEEAEKRFRDCRVRAHSENIGLARMPDGSRLVRVGKAVPLELASWRYGGAMTRTRRRAIVGAGATLVGGAALIAGSGPLLAAGTLPAAGGYIAAQLGVQLLLMRRLTRPLLKVPAEHSPSGESVLIRQQHGYHMRLVAAEGGDGMAVEVPYILPMERVEVGRMVRWVHPDPLRLEGALAQRFLERVLVTANLWTAGRRRLSGALQRLDEVGGPGELMRLAASRNGSVFRSPGNAPPNPVRGGLKRLAGTFRGELIEGRSWKAPPALPREEVLALEIALHEEAERRALEGELAALEAAWRAAEEIAAIADALPDDPLRRLELRR